jgi:SAM-dependent methyltransferase
MKSVACYFCGSSQHAPYAHENGFALVKCAGCGLLYVNPRPDDADIDAAMRSGMHRGEDALDVVGQHDPRKVAGYVTILKRLFGGREVSGSWLDIGCGHGELLEALGRFGSVAARGLEPCAPKADSARARGLHIVDEGAIAPQSLDAISALNVYSHLPDPHQALRQWATWLRPGGWLIVQTGDSCDLPYRDHHQPFDLPDHLSFANRRIVWTILERAGYVVLRSHHQRHGAYPAWQLWRHPYRDMWLLARKRLDA